MNFESGVEIKQEKEDCVEDNNDNNLQVGFDIDVKVEDEAELDEDWCMQNLLAAENFEQTINYNDLKKETLHTCIVCLQHFTNTYSLCKHNLTHLMVPLIRRKFFICNDCPSLFSKKIDLENHIILSHITKKKSEETRKTKQKRTCEICSKTYTYKSWFGHMRQVHGQLKVKCEMCNGTFKCERYLKRHILYIHHGHRPAWRYQRYNFQSDGVECSECSNKFSNKISLRVHVRDCHSKERHQCKICKSVLKSKTYLMTHMRRVHYNDGKLHSCDICGKMFKSPRYVNSHIKNSHSYKAKLARALKCKY